MPIQEATRIVFGLALTLGSIFLLAMAFRIQMRHGGLERRCTAKTMGVVKGYTRASRGGNCSGIFLPVVSYCVNGEEYTAVGPEYKAYVMTSKSSPFRANDMHYEEKNQVFYLYRNSNSLIGVHRNPMEELYPLSSQLPVYYDPKRPKSAYVLHYCDRKGIFWIFLIGGLLTLASALLFLLLA